MEPDPIVSKIFCSFPNILQYQFIDIQTSGAGQSNNISCSVVSKTRDIRISFDEIVADGPFDGPQFVAGGFARESDEPLKYLHLVSPNQCKF